MSSKTYLGDVGTVIELDTGVSLAGASALSIEAARPDGTTVSWTATATGTSVRYTTQAGDLDVSGAWVLQAKATIGSGTWRGESVVLRVWAAFE